MKKVIKITHALLISLFLSACSFPHTVTTWKRDAAFPAQYAKIMVTGIIKSKDDSCRLQIENRFAIALGNLQYQAVTSLSSFGSKGLAGLSDADTYLTLCNNGIDVLMTVALIDESKEARQRKGSQYRHPARYYYSRIWNYKNIQADLDMANSNGQRKQYFWEIIVYDLKALEAVCVIQTKSFMEVTNTKVMDNFAEQVMQQLVKEKILTKKRNNSKSARPF